MSDQIHSYTELQQQIHQDLRIQHPDWIEPNGDCPTCDSYESRLGRTTWSQSAVERAENAQFIAHGPCGRVLNTDKGNKYGTDN